ncbi:hypothetical protein FSP39_015257 [Pinctada imbricata]|uniref:Threonylcarbamoyl-AMP synthase n=1 Tax=Pinctada imbricata TaxID=66713 RepID=A0AA89C183_PINIB|nr:hypothetical protein FSP39_015257 [Pinctada imbricata]
MIEIYTCTCNMCCKTPFKMNNECPDFEFSDFVEAVEAASSSLRGGHIIAVPTDTIYGIAGLSQHSEAIEKIYNIKRRDLNKPIAISVADIDDIFRWCHVTVSKTLLSELLPGPVTLVFQRTNELNPELNPNTPLVGVRIPDNKFIRSVARACDSPLALTSANISAAQSTLNVQEFEDLWPKLDKVFDGGALGDTFHSRQGSTVVDLSTQGKYKVIRDGRYLKKNCYTIKKQCYIFMFLFLRN